MAILNNFFNKFDIQTVTTLAIAVILLWWSYMMLRTHSLNIGKTAKGVTKFTGGWLGKRIRKKELDYMRDTEIGLVKKNSYRRTIYTLLNDLTIDLNLKIRGCSPYELLFFLFMLSVVISLILAATLSSLVFGFLSFPIVFFAVACSVYTKANASHAARIGATIEAENIICNNISSGVKVAVRSNINSFPKEVKNEFMDYLNELDDNTHPVTALRHLNDKLGSISDSFISSCIQFEMNASNGTGDTFQDIVEMNAYMTTVRIKMERTFEQITNSFISCVAIILVFFVAVLAIYPFVRDLYLTTLFGNILLLLDLFLIVLYFVIITYYRAKNYYGD